ncbi:cystatin-A [Microcebus murinus]|uniref:Cystatin A n=1 Tax=Microcebus murinus TaxID=30608 RepID=A0A8B7HIH4_MICMU|nr:cystatin-A [Microcebus murinus]
MSPPYMITSVPASCPAKKPSAKMIPGGLSDAKPATAEIQEIADKVKPQLEEKTNETYEEFEAVEYKTQVVAGINYYIKVRVCENCYMHLKVFKSLPGQGQGLELSGYQTDKTKEDELTGF